MLLWIHQKVSAQQTIEGRVLDAVTNEAMAFVNISAGGQYGATTNIDGVFSITLPAKATSLQFSFVGYEKLQLPIDTNLNYPFLTVYLKSTSLMLEEVTVGGSADENPAKRIMRKVIRNKLQHRPESLPYFSFKAYRKVTVNPIFKEPEAFPSRQESFKNRYIGLIESFSNVYYQPENGFREEIEAVQASGFKEPRFATLTTQMPFFSFYQESFKVLEQNYYSPIANGALRKYDYQLTDTLYSGSDSVFVIRYQPKRTKTFDALQGVLYINTNGYAIQNVIAEPWNRNFIEMRVEQQYTQVDQKWFPDQLLYRIHLPEYPSKALGVSIESRTYLNSITFEPSSEATKWGGATIKVKPKAYLRDSLKWRRLRPQPLDTLEQFTYEYMDSVAQKTGIRFLENVFNSTITGLYPAGPLAFRLGEFIHYNEYESLRPGIGLQTNPAVFGRFTMGGYIGIGFRDESVKYQIDSDFLLVPSYNLRLQLLHRKTVEEPAQIGDISANFLQKQYTRRLMAARMSEIRSWHIQLVAQPWRQLTTKLHVASTEVKPLFLYQFTPEQSSGFATYEDTQVGLHLTFSPQSITVNDATQQQTLRVITQPPLFSFIFQKGQITEEQQEIPYERYQVAIHKIVPIKGGSRLSLRLEGGYINRTVPYPLLFHGKGSSADGSNWIDVAQTFRTMGIYEFLHDRFANVFIEATTGKPIFKMGIIQPEPVLVHASGWGWFKQNAKHEGIAFQTMDEGFHETGLQLHNLIGINYVNLARLGLGAGVYYRHGVYRHPQQSDNLSYKLLFRFNF